MKSTLLKISKYMVIFIMAFIVAPLSIMAAHDQSGKPTDLRDSVYVAIYNGDEFPGEPAIYGISPYTNFNSQFEATGYQAFATSASSLFKSDVISDLIQGAPLGNQKVWGVYNTSGIKDYFVDDSAILDPANELKIIKEMKGNDATLDEYEIIWYVIKYQSSDGFLSRDDWHLDGVIKKKNTYSVNYYGNGNTAGHAPNGVTGIVPGGSYTVLGNVGELEKQEAGINYQFLGWSTKQNATVAQYTEGSQITDIRSNISLYAVWEMHVDYSLIVNTYLDNTLTNINNIVNGSNIFIRLNGSEHNITTNNVSVGTYQASLPNGVYNIWVNNKMIDHHQVVIENDSEEISLHYYSVRYKLGEGESFETNKDPGISNLFTGSQVNTTSSIPTKAGYEFKGWLYNNKTYAPGQLVTNSINSPIVLTPVWEKLVNVTINVNINHMAGTLLEHGYDEGDNKDYLVVELLSKDNLNSPYLETGQSITFTRAGVDGYSYLPQYAGTTLIPSEVIFTKYQATTTTFTGLEDVYYTALTSKSGYDVINIEEIQDPNTGDWVINIDLKYNPDDFNLNFTIYMDEKVPENLYPNAVIVKIARWENDHWELIPQQAGNLPGIRVNIPKDGNEDTLDYGVGSYPVWKYISDTSGVYVYKIVVTAFVYANNTIVPVDAQAQLIANEYTDKNYLATMGNVEDGLLFGGYKGAYYAATSDAQVGTLDAIVSVKTYKVIFHAMGGKVNTYDEQEVDNLYQIPAFDDYQPIKNQFNFLGWYLDREYTKLAIENTYLTEDITLYAKWSAIQTLEGMVILDGTDIHSNATINALDRDLPNHVTVILQELIYGDNGLVEHIHTIDSQTLDIKWNQTTMLGTSVNKYSFTKLDGLKTYRIDILLENFTNYYQNETTPINTTPEISDDYHENHYIAVYKSNPNNTFVNAYLDFDPEKYDQAIEVDSSAIGQGYRPTEVHTTIVYKLAGEYDDKYVTIIQHQNSGIDIMLNGEGYNADECSVELWRHMWNGTLYIYQARLMNATINSDLVNYDINAPYTVNYGPEVAWNYLANASSGPLKIRITPNSYKIYFDLNTTDTVTGMDSYLNNGEYIDEYTWSYGKSITANPVRKGYKFMGWTTSQSEVITEIDPSMHKDITLIAKWEKDLNQNKKVSYTVNHEVEGTIKDTLKYEVDIWIFDEENLMVTNESLLPNTYYGYSFKEIKDGIQAGDFVVNGSIITLVYEKAEFNYIVEYYYDDIKDDSKTEIIKALYKSEVNNYDSKQPEGYILEKVVGLPLIISYDESQNIIKVYYATDKVGGGEDGKESDLIPDKYQKKIVFKVVNGTWEKDNKDIIKYVTLLDKEGNPSADGVAKLDAPTDMKAIKGYENGSWDVIPPKEVKGTDDEVYTYTFVKTLVDEGIGGVSPIVPEVSNPNTSDNILSYISTMIISIIGLVITLIINRKEKEI